MIDLILSPPVIGLVLVLALATLYKIALPLKPPWYRGLPGAVLAAVVFLAGATGLRLYLDWLTGTGYTYGALAAPIAFLLGTFFIGMAIVLGAHFNASIQALWPVPLRTGATGWRGPKGGRSEPVGVGGGERRRRGGAGRGRSCPGQSPTCCSPRMSRCWSGPCASGPTWRRRCWSRCTTASWTRRTRRRTRSTGRPRSATAVPPPVTPRAPATAGGGDLPEPWSRRPPLTAAAVRSARCAGVMSAYAIVGDRARRPRRGRPGGGRGWRRSPRWSHGWSPACTG